MFLTHFQNENFSLSRVEILYGESDGVEIRITNDQCYKHDSEKLNYIPEKTHRSDGNDPE